MRFDIPAAPEEAQDLGDAEAPGEASPAAPRRPVATAAVAAAFAAAIAGASGGEAALAAGRQPAGQQQAALAERTQAGERVVVKSKCQRVTRTMSFNCQLGEGSTTSTLRRSSGVATKAAALARYTIRKQIEFLFAAAQSVQTSFREKERVVD